MPRVISSPGSSKGKQPEVEYRPRVSYADFEDVANEALELGGQELTESRFTEACRNNPAYIYRLTGKIMDMTRRAEAKAKDLREELEALRLANDGALAQMSALDEEVDFLREQLKEKEAEVKKRTAMVQRWEQLHDERKAEVSKLQTELRQSRSRSKTRGEPGRSMSPMSRRLADCVGSSVESSPGPAEPLKAEHIRRSESYFMDPQQLLPVKTDKATPAPSPFTGMDKDYSVNEFARLMETKLSATTFRSEDDGLRYVLSHLKGPAFRLCAPRVPSVKGTCTHPFDDVDDLLKELRRRYGHVDTEARALSTITQLKQGANQSFNSVYSRFLEYRSQLAVFTDAMEMNAIQGMLNDAYSRILSAQAPCDTATEMVRRLTHIDDEQKRTKFLSSTPKPPTTNATTPRRWDRSTTRTSTPSTPATTTARGIREFPEKYRNLPPLTPEVRSEILRENRCLRCREAGHRQTDPTCPLTGFERPNPAVRSAEVGGQGHITGHVTELSENGDAAA